MSPPSDGARPVAKIFGYRRGGSAVMEWTGKPVAPGTLLYTAADYDALRAEVERLSADRETLQRDGTHPAPCGRYCEATAFTIEIRNLKSRAEAAEAKVDEANDRLHEIRRLAERLTKQYQIDVARELFAALNEGDGE